MPDDARTVSVSGRGQVAVPPDIATVTLGVEITSMSTDAAIRTSNEIIARVTAALHDLGIADDDIALGWFSVRTVYDHIDGRRELRGYAVSHDLTVKVREIDRTGAVLSTAISAGATEVKGLSFSVEDPTPATDRARERAFADARHKAEELARLAGVSLGAVRSMSEQSYTPVPVERREFMRFSMAESAAPPPDVPINLGDTTFSVDVQVVWDLG
jgi:uncharacterized protein YggE